MAAEPFVAVTLARVVRPWGRRGEVAAEILTDIPKHLTALREAWLFDGRQSPKRVAIRSCRLHLGQAVIHFAGIESINDAERLRGVEVQIPLAKRARLPAGRYYVNDLIGCQVWEAGSAEPLGTVQEVQRTGEKATDEAWSQSHVLEIATARGELLVPLAAEICVKIDTAARRIEVRLPDGLTELNAK